MFVGSKLGIANFWKEEAFLRKLRETITFLHQQAGVDQVFYRLDFNFEEQSYLVSAIQSGAEAREQQSDSPEEVEPVSTDVGYLSQELSQILSPALGSSYELIPPPSFPSLGQKVLLPDDMSFSSIKTQRGEFDAKDPDQTYIMFSPRGSSEFAVLYLNQGEFGKITILVNPFSGTTELYREEREFDWNYGKETKDSKR
jgi:hypothetical protein